MMCLTIYVGTNLPQEQRWWDKKRPAFNTDVVHARKAARLGLSKPYVYELGAHTGCGCGFLGDDSDDEPAHLESVSALRDFLQGATETGDAEVLVCWMGDEKKDADRQTVMTSQIERLDFGEAWDRPLRLTVHRA